MNINKKTNKKIKYNFCVGDKKSTKTMNKIFKTKIN